MSLAMWSILGALKRLIAIDNVSINLRAVNNFSALDFARKYASSETLDLLETSLTWVLHRHPCDFLSTCNVVYLSVLFYSEHLRKTVGKRETKLIRIVAWFAWKCARTLGKTKKARCHVEWIGALIVWSAWFEVFSFCEWSINRAKMEISSL